MVFHSPIPEPRRKSNINMKTKNKKENAFRAPSHPEQLSTDNNTRRLYKVTVYRTNRHYMKVRQWAESEYDAKRNAEKYAVLQQASKWKLAKDDRYAFDVKQVKEGGSHE